MNHRSLIRMRLACRYTVFSVFVISSIFVTGCVYDPTYYGPPPHYHHYPHYYDYYYYPYARVYFHFTTGIYYYRDGGIWVTAKILPPHIHIDAKNRVRIRVESDKPYLKFNEHTRIYKFKPSYSVDLERSRKERDANQRWFQEYKKEYPKGRKKHDNF